MLQTWRHNNGVSASYSPSLGPSKMTLDGFGHKPWNSVFMRRYYTLNNQIGNIWAMIFKKKYSNTLANVF